MCLGSRVCNAATLFLSLWTEAQRGCMIESDRAGTRIGDLKPLIQSHHWLMSKKIQTGVWLSRRKILSMKHWEVSYTVRLAFPGRHHNGLAEKPVNSQPWPLSALQRKLEEGSAAWWWKGEQEYQVSVPSLRFAPTIAPRYFTALGQSCPFLPLVINTHYHLQKVYGSVGF